MLAAESSSTACTHVLCMVLQVMGPDGHRRLQEAPSGKFLMHSTSMDQQMQMAHAANSKEAHSGLFSGPQSSDFNIKATS